MAASGLECTGEEIRIPQHYHGHLCGPNHNLLHHPLRIMTI